MGSKKCHFQFASHLTKGQFLKEKFGSDSLRNKFSPLGVDAVVEGLPVTERNN